MDAEDCVSHVVISVLGILVSDFVHEGLSSGSFNFSHLTHAPTWKGGLVVRGNNECDMLSSQ